MRGSVEKRGEKVYRLRVFLGRDQDGKKKYHSKTFHGSKKEADLELSRMLADVGMTSGGGGTKTIDDVVETYLRRTKKGRYVDDCRYAWKLVPDSFKARKIGTLTPGDFEELYDELRARTKIVDDVEVDDPVSLFRIQRIHNLCRQSLNLAARRRWIHSNPANLAVAPKVEKRTPKPPSRETLSKLVDAADGELLLWIRVASTTGARRGEIAGLRWSDVDFDAGTLTISRAISYSPSTGVVIGPTKTGNVRKVSLGVNVLAELEDARDEQRGRSERLSGSWDVERYVFGNDPEGREPWKPDRATKTFVRLRDRLGLGKDVRLKELRHFVATELIGAGVDVVTVAGRLGHSSPKMTADVYASFLAARDREAAVLLD